jgi:hypothetical protein
MATITLHLISQLDMYDIHILSIQPQVMNPEVLNRYILNEIMQTIYTYINIFHSTERHTHVWMMPCHHPMFS